MNPQNVGQHIPLRHSSLWRKPLLYQKAVQISKQCHQQLNQMAASGRSWRYRNNSASNLFTFNKKQLSPHKKAKINLSKQIHNTTETQVNRSKLIEEMQIMKGSRVTVAAYPGVGRQQYICNDYHSKVTNAGYSRNTKGKFFTS